ncbi:MAG: hypothetical protein R3C61_15870 [Bacteroidia bacterium]
MKKILLLSSLILLSLAAICQPARLSKTKALKTRIQSSTALSAAFKQNALIVLAADDDCTPPPCGGIIDPWTCECTPDTKDPWGDDSLASRLRAFQTFEANIQKGLGKDILPGSLVTQAKQKFPGNSLTAIVNRMNFYVDAGKK